MDAWRAVMSCIQPVKLRVAVSPRTLPWIGSLPGTSSSVMCSPCTLHTLAPRGMLRTRGRPQFVGFQRGAHMTLGVAAYLYERERETEALELALESALAGDGGLVALLGPAGIG